MLYMKVFVTLRAQDQIADHYGAVCKFAISSAAGGREPVCTCVCELIQSQACAVLTDEDDLFEFGHTGVSVRY